MRDSGLDIKVHRENNKYQFTTQDESRVYGCYGTGVEAYAFVEGLLTAHPKLKLLLVTDTVWTRVPKP